MWPQVLDRHDGSYIVRYKVLEHTEDLVIEVKYQGKHVAKSPYELEGMLVKIKSHSDFYYIDFY